MQREICAVHVRLSLHPVECAHCHAPCFLTRVTRPHFRRRALFQRIDMQSYSSRVCVCACRATLKGGPARLCAARAQACASFIHPHVACGCLRAHDEDAAGHWQSSGEEPKRLCTSSTSCERDWQLGEGPFTESIHSPALLLLVGVVLYAAGKFQI